MKKSSFLFLVFLVLLTFGAEAQHRTDTKKTVQKFNALIYYIENFYVDTTRADKLTETAIVSMLKELDPHSAYISKDDLQAANEQLVGSFEGVGITYSILNDTIMVVSPVVNGPSEKVGIMASDKIIKIDGEEAVGPKVTNKFVTSHLRGEKGSKVVLSIKRGDSKELIDFEVVRDKIPLYSIDATFMLDKEIGYIKLNQFAKNTIQEFEESLAKLRQQNMKSLVLDLRGNSGGYLNVAVALADEFLSEGKLVVYTEGTHNRREDFNSTKSGGFEKGNMVILIDEGSASASEIVSGAVQDWDRGIIVGRRSFGKGLVQRPFDLPDGSQVRLTTSRYYTPTGRCIQRSYSKGVDDYHKDLAKRLERGELYNSKNIHFPDSLKYNTPNGRIVYGGGGIMPDVFVPIDTTSYSIDFYSDLVRKGLLNKFTLSYVSNDRATLMDKYPTFNKFAKKFEISDDILEKFVELSKLELKKWDESQYEKSKEFIKTQLKALIARNLWTNEQYYQVMFKEDNVVKTAMNILSDKHEYSSYLMEKQLNDENK